jgi:putative ABC transport system substrate-binding protein
MNRREFITGLGWAAVASPLGARAQQTKTPIIGYLGTESPEADAVRLRAFRQGLSEIGYVEGRNVAIEYRWMDLGHFDRIPSLAADLVRRQVAVIVVIGGPDGTRAARAATETIPIVFFTGGDPVTFGLVASLNRPGGNVTGATSLAEELGPKRLELMHTLLPEARIMALVVNPNNSGRAGTQWKDMQAAAGALGVQLHILNAASERDFDAVFASLVQIRATALVLDPDPLFFRYEELVVRTARLAIPTISFNSNFVAAGGLMSYGNDNTEAVRTVGIYTGRILKGEKPADLPVQQATKIELAINLKTAKALRLTIPEPILLRADKVIE